MGSDSAVNTSLLTLLGFHIPFSLSKVRLITRNSFPSIKFISRAAKEELQLIGHHTGFISALQGV